MGINTLPSMTTLEGSLDPDVIAAAQMVAVTSAAAPAPAPTYDPNACGPAVPAWVCGPANAVLNLIPGTAQAGQVGANAAQALTGNPNATVAQGAQAVGDKLSGAQIESWLTNEAGPAILWTVAALLLLAFGVWALIKDA